MNNVRNEPSLQTMPTLDRVEQEPADHVAAPPPDPEFESTDHGSRSGRSRRATRRLRRTRRLRWATALIALAGIAAFISMVWQPKTVSQLPAVAQKSQAPEVPEAARARYPIETVAASLPALDASDAVMVNTLQGLWSGAGIVPFLEPRNIVRNIVVTVDNLPRRTLPPQKSPLKPPAGSFGTAIAGNGLVIGDTNALRYATHVRLFDTVATKPLVDAYVRHYPLFQQAYRELGYPDGHFNDRLVDAIDVMLATPDVKTTLAVVQPKIFYEFADRELEQLPAGQKLLLRMGRENAAIVKTRLRELRRLVTHEELDFQAVSSPQQPR